MGQIDRRIQGSQGKKQCQDLPGQKKITNE